MSNPIPQLVNISHALQSNMVQQIRTDVASFTQPGELSTDQVNKIDNYLSALKSALTQFTNDNKHIENNDPSMSVTDLDIQLYSGLKAMYIDYINQLNQIKLSNSELKQRQEDDKRIKQNIKLLNDINETLPIKSADERRLFFKNLTINDNYKFVLKSNDLLASVVKLCELDLSTTENIKSYITFLKSIGYSKETLKKELPSSITKPIDEKVKIKKTKSPKNSIVVGMAAGSNNSNSSISSSNSSNSSVTESSTVLPKVKKKRDIYIANATGKKDKNSSLSGEVLNKDTDVILLNNKEKMNDAAGDDDGKASSQVEENKKKISFSKYLKKDDSDTTATESPKRSASSKNVSLDEPTSKRIKNDDTNEVKPISILKNGENIRSSSRVSKSMNINFSDNLMLYGDDLPDSGLKVTSSELKKILKPFKEGEPNEKLHFGDFRVRPMKLIPLVSQSMNVEEIMDISELKGGPVSCQTRTPPFYREEFQNFNKELKKKPPREPILSSENENNNDAHENDNSMPLVAKAFGKNALLLKKDRGGLPYKRVPEIPRNNYPPKHIR
ncbi:hypothetical protein KAFR_0B06180 [Kazachstania africana CBS 2517]|uniref:Uncharacterized protein n=1 Tax=Kazachstania africana (strain ATCC 22294 / BCRC 22015 / CBS 2517 / CECT 1963 / NBRC 1671 / NRRL Y-8276) TaxID=1071382 RepID=H2ARB5_KAZAF|nr:hypothetical protein KAFR_0B06180 [Kazachstania africana CBS 2517]CCF56915.1 hypothetical protein KAFR_0B06180 [Kazachstania africana CBS 2517]